MTYIGRLNAKSYFALSFIMTEVGNLDAKLGGTLHIFFHNSRCRQFFFIIRIHPIAIISHDD